MAPAAMKVLLHYAWPGNIRELENAIERAVVVTEGAVLNLDDLPEEVRKSSTVDFLAYDNAAVGETAAGASVDRWAVRSERERRDRDERAALEHALAATAGNKAEAARLLGMARSTLVSRLKKHRLLQDRF